jgi:hypothetical protein
MDCFSDDRMPPIANTFISIPPGGYDDPFPMPLSAAH